MKLLFNKEINQVKEGKKEIKDLLGHTDADYKFANLQTDIEHETIDLIKLIGQSTYDAIEVLYQKANPTEAEADLIKKAQLPILVFAELAYASNNDLHTSNNGRTVKLDEYERQPWEWQIERSESNSRRRGYKALDVLINTLDNYGLAEWDNSEEYKASKEYFIYTTDQFHKIYPIDNSRQLFMRLQAFMNDPEEDEILPRIGDDRFALLKTRILDDDLDGDDKKLLKKVQRPIAFRALEDAFTNLPVEMFPSGIVQYREKGRMASQARSEVLLYFKEQADKHLKKLEDYITSLSVVLNEPSAAPDPLEHLDGGKFINL